MHIHNHALFLLQLTKKGVYLYALLVTMHISFSTVALYHIQCYTRMRPKRKHTSKRWHDDGCEHFGTLSCGVAATHNCDEAHTCIYETKFLRESWKKWLNPIQILTICAGAAILW